MVSAQLEPTASSGGLGAGVRDGMGALAGGKSILGEAIVEARHLRPPGGYPPLLETPDYACRTAGLLNFCDSKGGVALIVTPLACSPSWITLQRAIFREPAPPAIGGSKEDPGRSRSLGT